VNDLDVFCESLLNHPGFYRAARLSINDLRKNNNVIDVKSIKSNLEKNLEINNSRHDIALGFNDKCEVTMPLLRIWMPAESNGYKPEQKIFLDKVKNTILANIHRVVLNMIESDFISGDLAQSLKQDCLAEIEKITKAIEKEKAKEKAKDNWSKVKSNLKEIKEIGKIGNMTELNVKNEAKPEPRRAIFSRITDYIKNKIKSWFSSKSKAAKNATSINLNNFQDVNERLATSQAQQNLQEPIQTDKKQHLTLQ
jgi:hypothetical protein